MKTSRMTKAQLVEALDAANVRIAELEAQLSKPGTGGTGQNRELNHYRSWFHELPYGAVQAQIVSQDGAPADIIFIDANSAYETLSGKSGGAGKKIDDIFPKVRQYNPKLIETIIRVAVEGIPEKIEIYSPVLQKWFLIWAYSPQKGEVISIFDDITKEKLLEQELAEKNDLLEMVGDIAKVAGWRLDKESGKSIATDVLPKMFGHKSGQTFGPEAFIDSLQPTSREKLRRAIDNLNESCMPYDLELEATDNTGARKFVRTIGIPTVKDGEIINAHGIIQDITDQKIAESALRESELKFRALFDNMLNGSAYCEVIFDGATPVDFRYIEVNKALEEMTGLADVSGKKGSEVFPEFLQKDRELFEIQAGVALTGIPRKVELYLNSLKQWHAVSSFSTEKGFFSITVENITERKESERKLREKEKLYRSLFENMLNGSAYCQVILDNGRPVDFFFVEVNDAFEAILGLRGIAGKKASRVFPAFLEKDRPLFESMAEVARTGIPRQLEYHLESLDKWHTISAFSTEEGFFSVTVQDITERKKAEKDLAESEKRYRLITDNIVDVILLCDVEGNSTFITPSHKRILGRGEEVLGKSIFSHIHPDDVPELTAHFEDAKKNKIVTLECRYRHPSRGYIWLEVNGRFFDLDGVQTGMTVCRDVTKRKQSEEAIKKFEKRLEHSSKMEAIGTLAGGIAHDFNNILSAMMGYADLAKLAPDDREKLDQRLEEVLQGGVRARELVKQILTFSRQTAVKMAPVNIGPLVRETLKFLKASLPATIEIREKIRGGANMVMGDPTNVHQIVMNLCTNAAHAMRDRGGVLDIQLSEVVLEDELDPALSDLKAGPYVKLLVADTGCGITEEVLPKIFDPFFTTKERGEGTGMGLSVVHGIVEDMKGRISVYSSPGRGTTVNIFFPKCEEQAAPAVSFAGPAETGSGSILLVDDNPHVLGTSSGILKLLGYEVTRMESPLMAIDCFESNPDAYDLVVTDMTMPKMTGLELSERILRIRPGMPIILCTGFSPGLTLEEIRKTGIRELVMKPLNARELAEAVSSAMGLKKD